MNSKQYIKFSNNIEDQQLIKMGVSEEEIKRR
jgi:hypothetical protein